MSDPRSFGKHLCATLLSTIFLAGAGAAAASSVTMQTNLTNAGAQASPAAYIAAVEASLADPPQPGYGTAQLPVFYANNHTLFGSDRNLAFLFTVEFVVAPDAVGSWSFRAGMDFGYGGVMMLDDSELDFRQDIWWGESWDSPDVMHGSLNLQEGTHTLRLYGLEPCCDGNHSAQFRIGNGGWVTFGSADGLQPSPVPEPGFATMLLTGGALLAMQAARRRRHGEEGFAIRDPLAGRWSVSAGCDGLSPLCRSQPLPSNFSLLKPATLNSNTGEPCW